MKNKSLQIDVKGFVENDENVVELNLIVDGRNCLCLISNSDYEALNDDGVFIRTGKEKDSAGVLNTTNVFVEQL